MTLQPKGIALPFICAASLIVSASAEIITPSAVTSSTAGDDLRPASTLIDGSGLSPSALTERTLHTVTHADAASDIVGWVTEFYGPDYFEVVPTPPQPVLTFELTNPATINGFAYWGYLFEGSFAGNESKAFTLTFFDSAGSQIGPSQNLVSSERVGLKANICSLPPVSQVKTITVEITDNFFPATGGQRVGLSEVRFLGKEDPGSPIDAETSLGAGGANGHDPYFGDYSQTIRLGNGSIVTAFSVRDNSAATPQSPDGEGYGAYFRIYRPDGSPVSAAPITPYSDINPDGLGWQSRPILSPLANGDFAVAWGSSGGPGDVGPGSGFFANGDAYTRVFQPDGTPRSATVKVNESEPTGAADDQTPVSIVPLAGGGFALVWADENDNSGNSDDYFVRAFSSMGAPIAASIQLGGSTHDPFFQDFGSLIALDNGGFAASWRTRDDGTTPSPDGDRYGAFFQTFTGAGVTNSPVITPYSDINPFGTGGQNLPLLAPIPNGLAVTWNSAYGPGDVGDGFNDNNGGDTYVRVYNNSGAAVSSTTQVNDLTDQWQDTPVSMKTLANGHFVIAWRDGEDGAGPNQDDFFVRSFSPTGAANGPSLQLGDATHEILFQDFGNLIALDDDGFAASWRTRDSDNNGLGTSADGEGFGSFLQIFDADGTARSAIIIPYLDINPSGTGSQNRPQLAPIPGGLAASWNSAYGPGDTGSGSNSTSGGDTYTRIFNHEGVPYSSTTKAHSADPTGTVDVQFPLTITASLGTYAVVVQDDNDNSGNKDDFFIRFFSTPADPFRADFNSDSHTDFQDLIIIRDALAGEGTAGQPVFDLNGDSFIDVADLDAFFLLADMQVRTVTSPADSGNGTLRKIIDSVGPGTATYIPFATLLTGSTTPSSSGQIIVEERIFVDASALIEPPVLDGLNLNPIFRFNFSAQSILDSLILTNGTGFDGGAIINNGSDLTIRFSTLANNTATNHGGAIFNFGNGSLTLLNSTLSNNFAQNLGGAIISFEGNLSLANTTLAANNTLGQGSALWAQGAGTLALEHVTAAGNTGNQSIVSFLPTTIENSIITGNSPNNFFVQGGPLFSGSNLVLGDPFLAPLDNYGGPTQTMIPLPGSPALDQIQNPIMTEDQRNFVRSGDADIGAAEYSPANDLPFIWDSDFDLDRIPLGAEIALGTDPNVSDAGSDKRLAPPILGSNDDAKLTFGWNSSAPPGTRWVISRSTDLVTFDPIFRYDGDSVLLGSDLETSFNTSDDLISYQDKGAPADKAFYRFEAEYLPPSPR